MKENTKSSGKLPDRKDKEPSTNQVHTPPKQKGRESPGGRFMMYSPPIVKKGPTGKIYYERPVVRFTQSSPAACSSAQPSEPIPPCKLPPPIPVGGGEIVLAADGTRFAGPMVDLEIGVPPQRFTAHVAILSQSPRLRQQFSSGPISLPFKVTDILPRTFRFVLEYLYTHTIDYDRWDSGDSLAMELAILYVEAIAFGLDSLKHLIVCKLESMPAIKDNPTLVLELAEEVYRVLPKTDRFFKDFFVKALDQCRAGPAKFPVQYADELIERGGDLAIDICKAERRRSSVLTEKEARRAKRLSYEGPDSEGNRVAIYYKSSSDES
ncbi:hypothetical protein MMC11_000775 [Xylographa trunciseda]|nr:hypothetical protein [Xylographa trunciseda]